MRGARASTSHFTWTVRNVKVLDEFNTCGLLGISYPQESYNDATLVIPDSSCVIDSVQQIARSWGWKVEKRPMPYTELPDFCEVLGAGTAVGLVAIRSITRRGLKLRTPLPPHARVSSTSEDLETITYVPDDNQAGGPVVSRLNVELKALQSGKVADRSGWLHEVQAEDTELNCCNEDGAFLPVPVI